MYLINYTMIKYHDYIICFGFFFYLVSPDGTLVFSEVKIFLEKIYTVTSSYKLITTSRKNTLYLTGNHLIYTKKSYTDKYITM